MCLWLSYCPSKGLVFRIRRYLLLADHHVHARRTVPRWLPLSCDELFPRFSRYRMQDCRCYVTPDILKTEPFELGLEVFHFYHRLAADVDSAKKCNVSHQAFCMSITNRYRTSDFTVRS